MINVAHFYWTVSNGNYTLHQLNLISLIKYFTELKIAISALLLSSKNYTGKVKPA